jgi:hypothetical protein
MTTHPPCRIIALAILNGEVITMHSHPIKRTTLLSIIARSGLRRVRHYAFGIILRPTSVTISWAKRVLRQNSPGHLGQSRQGVIQ